MKDAFDVILFDNDGILVDTEPLFLKATQEVMASIDIALRAEDYHEISMRQGRSVFELASARGVSDEEILRLRKIRSQRYADLIDEGVRILDGVAETLDRLHGERPMAIVTSSDRGHFDRIHDQTGLRRFFELILTEEDYTRHKPDPEPYLMAAERLCVDPERCLVIEDTERGLESAKAAGMSCIVIPNALSRTGDFRRAHHILPSMRSLSSVLGFE